MTPGWTTAKIRPCPGGLQYARGRVPTPLGPIEIDWKDDSSFQLNLSIPAGVEAQVELPAGTETTGVFVDGQSVEATKEDGRWVLKNKVSGSVTIHAK